MNSLSGVSGRVAAIYQKHYVGREAQRAKNLYTIFDEMASAVEAVGGPYRLHMDYILLGELIRSYFLDAIRYKEYHFDPDVDNPELAKKIKEENYDISKIDRLSTEWTDLVHSTANINKSKVAAYTVKWILACKPSRLPSKN